MNLSSPELDLAVVMMMKMNVYQHLRQDLEEMI